MNMQINYQSMFFDKCGFKESRFSRFCFLPGGGIFGDSFGAFTYCVFGKLTWKDQSHWSLNFPWWDCWSFIMSCKSWSFASNSFESVVNKRIHYVHCLSGDADIWMNLFQNFVDVNAIAFFARSSSFRNFSCSFLSTFLRSFPWTSCHCYWFYSWTIKRRWNLRKMEMSKLFM